VNVAPGETVAASAPLFEVVGHDRLWIRVPIYVGWWRDVDSAADALYSEYGRSPDQEPRSARPATAPPAADPVAATVDLVYETTNEQARLRPGQKLAVTVPMQGKETNLVVPLSAVIYDIHGSAWVYEQTAPQAFARRRVLVKFVDRRADGPPGAVVEAGLAEGAKVVSEAAVELYGAELGFAK
jgi:hypothetical protein